MILNNIGRGKKICMLCSNTKMHCFIFFLEEKNSFQKIILKKTTATIWKALCKIDLTKTHNNFLIYKYFKKKYIHLKKKLKHMASARAFQLHTYWYVCAGGLGEGEGLEKHFAAHVWKQFCRPGIPKDDNDSSYASICLYSTQMYILIQ